MEDIAAAIRKFIVEELMFEKDESVLKLDDSLLDGGIVDSMGILQLVVFLEKEYHVSIPNEELVPNDFQDVQAIARLVSSKVSTTGV